MFHSILYGAKCRSIIIRRTLPRRFAKMMSSPRKRCFPFPLHCKVSNSPSLLQPHLRSYPPLLFPPLLFPPLPSFPLPSSPDLDCGANTVSAKCSLFWCLRRQATMKIPLFHTFPTKKIQKISIFYLTIIKHLISYLAIFLQKNFIKLLHGSEKGCNFASQSGNKTPPTRPETNESA